MGRAGAQSLEVGACVPARTTPFLTRHFPDPCHIELTEMRSRSTATVSSSGQLSCVVLVLDAARRLGSRIPFRQTSYEYLTTASLVHVKIGRYACFLL